MSDTTKQVFIDPYKEKVEDVLKDNPDWELLVVTPINQHLWVVVLKPKK